MISDKMDTVTWLAEALSNNSRQFGFYKEVFTNLEKDGKFFPADAKAWDTRSVSRWLARLYEGDKNTVGLEIVERKRAGWQGKVFYQLSPMFKGNLNKVWRWVKKTEQKR